MKAELEFDLTDPEDRMNHMCCIKAQDMAIVLFEIHHNLKNQMLTKKSPKNYREGVEDTIRVIGEMMQDHGIVLTEITK